MICAFHSAHPPTACKRKADVVVNITPLCRKHAEWIGARIWRLHMLLGASALLDREARLA